MSFVVHTYIYIPFYLVLFMTIGLFLTITPLTQSNHSSTIIKSSTVTTFNMILPPIYILLYQTAYILFPLLTYLAIYITSFPYAPLYKYNFFLLLSFILLIIFIFQFRISIPIFNSISFINRYMYIGFYIILSLFFSSCLCILGIYLNENFFINTYINNNILIITVGILLIMFIPYSFSIKANKKPSTPFYALVLLLFAATLYIYIMRPSFLLIPVIYLFDFIFSICIFSILIIKAIYNNMTFIKNTMSYNQSYLAIYISLFILSTIPLTLLSILLVKRYIHFLPPLLLLYLCTYSVVEYSILLNYHNSKSLVSSSISIFFVLTTSSIIIYISSKLYSSSLLSPLYILLYITLALTKTITTLTLDIYTIIHLGLFLLFTLYPISLYIYTPNDYVSNVYNPHNRQFQYIFLHPLQNIYKNYIYIFLLLLYFYILYTNKLFISFIYYKLFGETPETSRLWGILFLFMFVYCLLLSPLSSSPLYLFINRSAFVLFILSLFFIFFKLDFSYTHLLESIMNTITQQYIPKDPFHSQPLWTLYLLLLTIFIFISLLFSLIPTPSLTSTIVISILLSILLSLSLSGIFLPPSLPLYLLMTAFTCILSLLISFSSKISIYIPYKVIPLLYVSLLCVYFFSIILSIYLFQWYPFQDNIDYLQVSLTTFVTIYTILLYIYIIITKYIQNKIFDTTPYHFMSSKYQRLMSNISCVFIYCSLILYILYSKSSSYLLLLLSSGTFFLLQQDPFFFKQMNKMNYLLYVIPAYLLALLFHSLSQMTMLKPGLFSDSYYEFFSYFFGNTIFRKIYSLICYSFCLPSFVNLYMYIQGYIPSDYLNVIIGCIMAIIALFTEITAIRITAFSGIFISLYLYYILKKIYLEGLRYL
ncbi:hypothetical protein WA158_001597 [Blastocystis sp. Blastoise]